MSTAAIGEYRWNLGRARWEFAAPEARAQTRAETRKEVERALSELSHDAGAHAQEIAEADAWLAAHPD